MAQAANPSSAKPETAETPASAPKAAPAPAPAPVKRSGKLLLIILLIAVLLLLLAVLGVGALLLTKKSTHANAEPPAPPPPVVAPVPAPFVSAVDLTKPPVFVPLESFTVNLRAGEGDENHYLQADISLRVQDQKTAESLKGWIPEIRNRINRILSTKSLSDLQNDMSHEMVQNEIMRGLNTMFGVPPPPPEIPMTQAPLGPIQGVLFLSFIVQ
jgi:flagellar FliL protein